MLHNINPHIIICEDEYIIASSIRNVLEYNGFSKVEIVRSAEDLMLSCEAKTPDLILLDLNLNGELDGIEAIERITLEKNIPFIVITGYSEYLSLLDSYNLDAGAVLQKPIDFSELIYDINKILSGR